MTATSLVYDTPLDPPEKCVHDYAGTASRFVNDVLSGRRTDLMEGQRQHVAHMTRSIDSLMAPADLAFPVWRGENHDGQLPAPGDMVQFEHYLSTSLMRHVGEEFAIKGDHRPRLWRIDVTPSAWMIDVAANTCALYPDSENLLVRGEQEILLARRTLIEVERIDESAETVMVYARAHSSSSQDLPIHLT